MDEDEPTSVQIGASGSYDVPLFTTSISYSDGMELIEILSEASEAYTIVYSHLVSGYFMVIDTQGKLQQIGSTTNADMRIASWAAQYEVYLQNIADKMSESSYVLPVMPYGKRNPHCRLQLVSKSLFLNVFYFLFLTLHVYFQKCSSLTR
jgi:hypothetical protein